MSNFLEDEDVTDLKKEKVNTLWAEKYRPTNLTDYVGNDFLKKKIQQYINENDIPHLLLFGGPGGGKTSASKLITKSIKCDTMYINASDESGVETIRGKVKNFASSIGFNSLKVIILDECLDEKTLVWVLKNGLETPVPIKDVDDKNDLVKSWNTKLNRVEWMPFDLWDKGEREVYQIELENGENIICTDDHKWYVMDGGCEKVVKTKDLYKYNHILSP